jgi:enoyl-CoA hydratase/carnithine racemase
MADDMQLIRLDIQDGVGRLTLTRAQKRNAINSAMADQFEAACGELRAKDVRVCILDAEGAVFTAGADVSDPNMSDAFHRLYAALLDAPLIWIGCVGGAAIGAGLAIVAACPIVVAGQGMWTSLPEISKIGNFPTGVVSKARKFVDRKWLVGLALSGDRADAAECHRMGLVTRLVPTGQELETAQQLAASIAVCNSAMVADARSAWLSE